MKGSFCLTLLRASSPGREDVPNYPFLRAIVLYENMGCDPLLSSATPLQWVALACPLCTVHSLGLGSGSFGFRLLKQCLEMDLGEELTTSTVWDFEKIKTVSNLKMLTGTQGKTTS